MKFIRHPLSKPVLTYLTLSVLVVILITYFLINLKQQNSKRSAEETLVQRETEARLEREQERRMYLMGKFNPKDRSSFVLIPKEHTLYAEGKEGMYLRQEAWDAFFRMQSIAELNGINLKIVSATRNFDYQKNIWNNKWSGVTLVEGRNLSEYIPDGIQRFRKILEYSAVPGTSRHHWGTDIDINGVNPPYFNSEKGEEEYAWLKKNAKTFGFCQTYNQKGAGRTTGYHEEKWHWSYMPLAREFLEEYKNLITEENIEGFQGDEYTPALNLINDYVLSINPDCI